MSWSLEVSTEFEQDYQKLCGRNVGLRRAVDAKIAQLREAPLHHQPLQAPLQGVRRGHVGGSFVLIFEPDVGHSTVRLLRLAHHDEAYGI